MKVIVAISSVVAMIFLFNSCAKDNAKVCDDCYRIQTTNAIGEKTGILQNCEENSEILTPFEKELLNFPDSIGFKDLIDTSAFVFDSTEVDNPYDSEVGVAPNPVRKRKARIGFLSNAALIKICITNRCYDKIYQLSLKVNTESSVLDIEFPEEMFKEKEFYKFYWRIIDHHFNVVIEGYNDIWICPVNINGGRPVDECF